MHRNISTLDRRVSGEFALGTFPMTTVQSAIRHFCLISLVITQAMFTLFSTAATDIKIQKEITIYCLPAVPVGIEQI